MCQLQWIWELCLVFSCSVGTVSGPFPPLSGVTHFPSCFLTFAPSGSIYHSSHPARAPNSIIQEPVLLNWVNCDIMSGRWRVEKSHSEWAAYTFSYTKWHEGCHAPEILCDEQVPPLISPTQLFSPLSLHLSPRCNICLIKKSQQIVIEMTINMPLTFCSIVYKLH